MKANLNNNKGIKVNVIACFLFLSLLLPATTFAELKPMTDSELKTTRLNDFVRPLSHAIIFDKKSESTRDIVKELSEAQAPVISTPEVYNPEAFYNDMQTQLDRINNGEAPVAGLFPFIQSEADKQHLLK